MSKLRFLPVEGEPDTFMAFGERSRSYIIRKRTGGGWACRVPLGTEAWLDSKHAAKAYAQGTEATHCERDVRAVRELPPACPKCGESLHCRGCANEEVRR